MKICLLTSAFLPHVGGHEIMVDDLAREFGRQGHAVTVLARQTRESAASADKFPYRVDRFGRPLSKLWAVPKMRRALTNLHRDWSFTLIHSFASYPTGAAAVQVGRRLHLPVVVTSQGPDLAHDSEFLRNPRIARQVRQTLQQAQAVTAISGYMKEQALRVCPDCASRLHEIPNAINCARLTAAVPETEVPALPPGIRDRRFLLFMGRLVARKGVDVLLDAYAMAASRLRGTPLVIAGDGKEMAALRHRAQQKNLSGNVHFLGAVQGLKKNWLLQQAQCVIVPTISWEGMPVIVLEAMACGRPVIGTRVGGTVDLIKDGRNGFMVEPKNPEALANALERLVNDPPASECLGRQAQTDVAPYDLPVVAMQYLTLFESLMRRQAAA